jgi:hypothetical protein
LLVFFYDFKREMWIFIIFASKKFWNLNRIAYFCGRETKKIVRCNLL